MRTLVTALSIIMLGCGSNPNKIQLKLTQAETALADATVSDIIVQVQNVINDGKVLDTNKNGIADSFVFPQAPTCPDTTPIPPQCGYKPNAQSPITLGNVPQNFKYQVSVLFRDASGVVKYNGMVEFLNSNVTNPLIIPVVSGAP